MADIKISNIPSSGALNGNEMIPATQGINPVKLTVDNISAKVQGDILPVNEGDIADKSVSLAKLTDAAKEYIGAAGEITNYPDDVTLELSGGVIKLKDILLHSIFDNVFIMYHRSNDNIPLMVKPYKWPALQTAGEIADGVVIVEGGHILVVAPTEASLKWSSAAVTGGGITTDRVTAMADWNGKANTAAQVTHTECSGVNYAPGYCNLYSRTNANGQVLTAGKWWLPSAGEMMMIYANMTKVNYALSLITGAVQLQEDFYWTSTELNTSLARYVNLGNDDFGWHSKTSASGHVRPVSEFIS